MPEVIRTLLEQLYERCVEEGQRDSSIMSVDSSLMHAHGNVGHAKQRKAGEIPSCDNIDPEAHWGVSGAGEVVPALAGVLVDLTVGLRLPPTHVDGVRSLWLGVAL